MLNRNKTPNASPLFLPRMAIISFVPVYRPTPPPTTLAPAGRRLSSPRGQRLSTQVNRLANDRLGPRPPGQLDRGRERRRRGRRAGAAAQQAVRHASQQMLYQRVDDDRQQRPWQVGQGGA